MASTDRTADVPARLREVLRDPLVDHPGGDPTDAARLACLLLARRRFETVVGDPPSGALASLPSPFGGFPVPDEARDIITDTCDQGSGTMDPAALADGYEAAIAPEARRERGQFFTPPPVADVLVRWALTGVGSSDGPLRVLDPAVGTGTFLLGALRRLAAGHPDRSRAELLDGLVGADVDGVALHLAGLRLAASADVPAPGRMSLHHASFFQAEPAPVGRSSPAGHGFEPVDAVVGNPPFVRAEAMKPETAHYRRHLAAFGPEGESPLLEGPDALSRRSDAYVYFVTHATRFLRRGGRLALVLPTKWLMSDYGEGLRRFLHERYRVHAVCGFGASAFGDALVDTALLLAERDDSSSRGPLRFVQVEGTAAAADLLDAITDGEPASPASERPQGVLTASGSLARFLEAPADLLALLEGPSFVRLDALGDIARGTMTGANGFFFLDDETAGRFSVEDRFRQPAVKSLRSVDRPAVTASEVDRWLLDVHSYVARVRRRLDDSDDPEAAVKDALADDGHDGLLGYIHHAEDEGHHEGRTCRSRAVWFDLGELRAPAAFVPKLLRERVFAVRNAADAVPSNAIDGVWPASDVDADALLAVLNASVGRAAMEVTGRDEAGMLQLMTYETASLPTLDVRSVPRADREMMAEAGRAYADDPGPASLATLDEAVDEAFNLQRSPEAIREQSSALRRRRVRDGGPVATSGD